MTDGRGHIAFQQIGLGSVLRQYRLRVPSNQREFSWTAREVTTLFQDFAKAINDNEGDYFLGTIVTIPRSVDELEVVDGQQRLATTAILLAAIRDYLKAREPLIAEHINTNMLTDIDTERRDRVPKLQLNLDDNEYFRAIVNGAEPGNPTKQSHELIRDAAKSAKGLVRNIVSTIDEKDHGDVLNTWLKFVQHSAQVILLRVPSDVNAYKMFETLNDRGLRTSQADLVKNYLFGQSGERLSEAQQKWALMRGALDTLDEDDITITFLRSALILLRGYLREPQVYEAVQRQARGPQTSIGFLAAIENMATTYVAMFNPEHEKWNPYPDPMKRAIKTLNVLGIKAMRPLTLAVASKFDPKEATKAFEKFISWEVRFLIAGNTRTGGTIEVPLATAARKVFADEIEDATTLAVEMQGAVPNDEQFRRQFEAATVSKASLARYYLRSLEMQAKKEPAPYFLPNDDSESINLEHVLPEKREGGWTQFTEDEARLDIRRIGNLALLKAKHNSDLRSADFSTKKAAYGGTPYTLTQQIATAENWNHETIVLRQQTLAKIALKTWPL